MLVGAFGNEALVGVAAVTNNLLFTPWERARLLAKIWPAFGEAQFPKLHSQLRLCRGKH
jgi:hypothetical protein